MKFLCVKCDEAMKLTRTMRDETIGALSAVFRCAKCESEVAMLTNPAETQLVSSLGVKIQPKDAAGEPTESKCPFANMLAATETSSESTSGVLWTEPAAERLKRLPEFVRSLARKSIETFAKEHGYSRIDDKVMDEAKNLMGM